MEQHWSGGWTNRQTTDPLINYGVISLLVKVMATEGQPLPTV